MNFYGIVLSIAIVLLILILTYVGLTMQNTTNNNVVFPPVEAKCPDYWDYNGNACVVPAVGSVNIGSIYSDNGSLSLNDTTTYGLTDGSVSGNSYIDFTTPAWSSQGLSGVCQKQKWASIYGIQWDGVSNYNSC
jgi:hypothetical protein